MEKVIVDIVEWYWVDLCDEKTLKWGEQITQGYVPNTNISKQIIKTNSQALILQGIWRVI